MAFCVGGDGGKADELASFEGRGGHAFDRAGGNTATELAFSRSNAASKVRKDEDTSGCIVEVSRLPVKAPIRGCGGNWCGADMVFARKSV